jgi:ubiquinone/menaquinone biosynthesis C-methylase UbiE
MGSQQHQSDPRILDRRSLWNDHRCLAGLLSSGMSVLDVGCGTGAITKGIAEAVGPAGAVIGVDRDRGLIERARAHCASLPNLGFEEGDATSLDYEPRFDVVTAARTLQWIADPKAALRRMTRAAKPGGLLVVLDYNHVLNAWQPAPPAEFAAFYSGFLSWRVSNGWDNELANHCSALFEEVGLREIRSYVQDETSVKGDEDFDEKTALWVEVIDNIGPALQSAQVCDAQLLGAARRSYDAWRKTDLVRHSLSMKATVARTR